MLEIDISQREFEWKRKRCGKITSSTLPDLMTCGRSKDDLFGQKALDVLYMNLYERRTKQPVENVSSKILEWGHENEPIAIDWFRRQFAFNTVKSCTNDFKSIVFNEPFDGFGDSPDFYMYDNDNNICAIGEVKCPVSQTKIEKLRFMNAITEKTEYYWQFLGHFVGTPEVDKLYYVIYDGYRDEGIYYVMNRIEHAENIEKLTERIKLCDEVLKASIKLKIDLKQSIPIALQTLPIRKQIDELSPNRYRNVPVINQITRLKKEITKIYQNEKTKI